MSRKPGAWDVIIWDDDPGGNVEHIAENGLGTEDVTHVLMHSGGESSSRSTGKPCVFGYTPDGRYVIVVFEEIDAHTVYPVTAYEVPEPKSSKRK
ncbi:MAG TPA: hypothetical protein VKX17_05680 [Planctomycetota bacterium]|nr:hypothetical protein [Planctomycetota bacterium]